MNSNPNPDPKAPAPRPPFDPRRSQFETLDDVRNPLPDSAPPDPTTGDDSSDRGTIKLGGPAADEPLTDEGPALPTDHQITDNYPALKDYQRRVPGDSGKADPFALPGEQEITPDQRSVTNKVDVRPLAGEKSAARPTPAGAEFTAIWQPGDPGGPVAPVPFNPDEFDPLPEDDGRHTLSLDGLATAPTPGVAPRPPRSRTVTVVPGGPSAPDFAHFEMEEYATAELPLVPGYEIAGELGRGGMGVVYKARQVSLNRLVALKMVLGGEFADPRELARFLGEAEAIAAISHPNVIQVYEYGRYKDMPFFAMEYVEGGSLAGWLKAKGPLGPKAAADAVEQIARGVQAAHDIGIIHRDLKPANVLLASTPDTKTTRTRTRSGGRLGSDFDPKVMDFGLAKRSGKNRDTKSLAVMGTPAYMSPEQAAGKSKFVGPGADIYALGVILYECLTGQLPFDAPDTISLIMRVVQDEPPPVRKFAPSVPRDLDLICLKCLEKDPRRRYPTAAALADDLVRFLNGELVEARAATSGEKFVRLVRRNPVLSGMTAALLLTAGAGVAFGGYQLREVSVALGQVKEEKDKAVKAEGEAKVDRDKAVAAEAVALAANQKYIDAAEAEKRAKEEAVANAKRADEQKTLAEKNEAEAKKNAAAAEAARKDEKVQREKAEAARKAEEAAKKDEVAQRERAEKVAGELKVALADLTKAKEATDAALANEKAAKTVTRQALDKLTDGALADFLNTQNTLTRQQEQFLAEVAAVYERLTKDGTGAENAVGLAETWTKLAKIHVRLGRTAQAEKAYAEAARLAGATGDAADGAVARADLVLNQGIFLSGRGDQPAEAEAKLREAVAAFKKLTATDQRVEVKAKLGQAYDRLGFHLHRSGKLKEAETELREAVKVREGLRAALPKDPEYAHRAAQSRSQVARVLADYGRPADELVALAEANLALKLQRDAVAAQPGSEPYRTQLADILNLVGVLATDPAKRWEAYQEALKEVTALAAAHPGDSGYKQTLATAKSNVASTLGTDRHEEAVALYREAIALEEQLVQAAPAVVSYQSLVAVHRYALAVRLRDLKRLPEAEQECQKAADVAAAVLKKAPDAPAAQSTAAKCLVELGTLDVIQKKYATGEQKLDAAWPLLAAALQAQPRVFDNWNTSRSYARASVDALAGQNKYPDIDRWAERLAKVGGRPELANLDAARMCARAAQAAYRASKDSPLVPKYQAACLQYVQSAVTNGLYYKTLENALTTDLFPFKDVPEMQALLKKAKENISK